MCRERCAMSLIPVLSRAQVGDLGFSWSVLCPPGLALVSAIGYWVREDQLLKNQCSSHRRPSLYTVAHRPAGWPGLHPTGSQGSKRFKVQAHRVLHRPALLAGGEEETWEQHGAFPSARDPQDEEVC